MTAELGDFIEAAGLLEYDPAAITRIYAGHPQRLIRRLWQTLVPIGLLLLGVAFDWMFQLLKDETRARSRARECAELLVDLGPAFIKAGQALSTRPDIVPPLLLEELAQLQDQLPGFDSDLAMACIEEDLGAPVEEIYAQLDRDPISAASLGQVHKGTLKDGQKVAVKVQRPGLREQITLDLYIVRNIAAWLNSNVGLIRSDLVALIDELGKRVFEEMDYLNEASNAEAFRDLHVHNPRIAVPAIYRNATSRRVLTMEWIDGVKLTNLDAVRELGIDPDDMVEVGVNCSLQQLLEHGFFHADPHPGNLFVLDDGRIGLIDFGQVKQISGKARCTLGKVMCALARRERSAEEPYGVLRDLEPLAELGDELGVVLRDGALRPEGPAAVSMWLFDDASEPLPGGFEQSELSPKAPAMSLKSFPQDLVFVARSSVLIKGLAARLGVKWSLASKWAPMAVEALDLSEKDARGVRRRGRLSKLGDGVKARVSRVVAPIVRRRLAARAS